MFDKLFKRLTKTYAKIPLFWVDFNLNKYRKYGAKGSCNARIHPELKDDKYIVNTLNGLIDYIRDNYNMEKLSR